MELKAENFAVSFNNDPRVPRPVLLVFAGKGGYDHVAVSLTKAQAEEICALLKKTVEVHRG